MAVLLEVIVKRNHGIGRFAGRVRMDEEIVVSNWQGSSRGHVKEL